MNLRKFQVMQPGCNCTNNRSCKSRSYVMEKISFFFFFLALKPWDRKDLRTKMMDIEAVALSLKYLDFSSHMLSIKKLSESIWISNAVLADSHMATHIIFSLNVFVKIHNILKCRYHHHPSLMLMNSQVPCLTLYLFFSKYFLPFSIRILFSKLKAIYISPYLKL